MSRVKGAAELKKLSTWVGRLPSQAREAATEAINTTVVRMKLEAETAMTGKARIPPEYIRNKLRMVRASQGRLAGALAMRRRAVPLARYGAQQLSVAATRARGDKLRGIRKGFKQAGVSVAVTGGRKRLGRAFLLPLMAGAEPGGNGWGIFVRFGPGRKDTAHLWGVGPDQLFRAWRDDNFYRVEHTLSANFAVALQRRLRK